MGKVELIEQADNAWATKIGGETKVSVGLDKALILVANKLNELIAAHNEHIETCKAGIDMRPPKSPNPSPSKGLFKQLPELGRRFFTAGNGDTVGNA